MVTMPTRHRDLITKRFLMAKNQVIALRIDGIRNDTQFAQSIGEYQQNLSKMENGERYPTLDMIGNLCRVYRVSPTWLILGTGKMFENSPLPPLPRLPRSLPPQDLQPEK